MKHRSLKQMALAILARRIEGWKAEAEKGGLHTFSTSMLEIKGKAFFERVSNVSAEQITKAIAASELIEVEGEQYLPTDLSIIKEHIVKGAAAPLVAEYDKAKSHRIPMTKLFQPSLFAEIDYEEERERWIPLGDTVRVKVGFASPEQWQVYRAIKQKNFDDQKRAHEDDEKAFDMQERLFRLNPDCDNTDALVKKLGLWKTK